MIEQGVDSDQKIAKGLAMARKDSSQFLPSPARFCQWCLPTLAELGYMDEHEAFHHARTECGKSKEFRKWHDDVVFTAAEKTGFYDLRSLPDFGASTKAMQNRFTKIYNELIAKKGTGEAVTMALPDYTKKTMPQRDKQSKKLAENSLNSLKGMFGGENE